MAYVCRSKNGVPPRFDFQHPVTPQICRHFHRAECAKEKDASKEQNEGPGDVRPLGEA